ncbi:hypothetical protein LguiA_022516 [Lonicera macranthoides]
MECNNVREQEEEEILEPMSPMGQFIKSSVLSFTIIGVLESEIPIDDSNTMALLQDLFLPINPRFSSILVEEKDGVKKWKRVKVNLKDHIVIPTFPKIENPPYLYDQDFKNYLAELNSSQLPQNQPLWEIHIIKYPTSDAAGYLIFKLHHSLGDGYSLVGALLSCLRRVDDPSLPLTFPSIRSNVEKKKKNGGILNFVTTVPKIVFGVFNTLCDFGWDVWKSNVWEDDISPIRSGTEGVEFQPVDITTVNISLDRIKQIKTKLNVTVNDVITGAINLGCRLYMQQTSYESRSAHTTGLVLLNTRFLSAPAGYKSVSEMVKPNSEMPWGNYFAFLNVSLPKLNDRNLSNPLEFVYTAQKMINRKKNSAAIYVTGFMLEAMRRLVGPQVASKYIHSTLKHASIAVSHVIGPDDRMALDNHPVKGLYFYVAGDPQSLVLTIISYAGSLRIAILVERGFIDAEKFKSCIENAFDMVHKATFRSP